MKKASLTLTALLLVPNLQAAPTLLPHYSSEQVMHYDFSDANQLKDWQVEGLGKMYLENEQLILQPTYQEAMMALHAQGKFGEGNLAKEYGVYLYDMVKNDHPKLADEMIINKVFRGGHVNYWNRNQTPENYAIEFDFTSQSSQALHMLMFSSLGLNGEDVLTGGLAPRVGLAQEIMHGDLHQYRISFFFPDRKTANMRRAPGRKMAAIGPDLASTLGKKSNKMVVTKWQDTVNYFVDGQHVLQYVDDKPFGGGNWGFRVMVLGKGAYDNVTVYRLTQQPTN